MKNIIGFVVVFFALSLLSCQDTREEAGSSVPDISLYKTVGMKIPTETGARWIEAYNERHNASGRLLGLLYSIDHDELESLVSSVNNLVGVAFHYGIDGQGNKHIITIPVDETMRLWNDVPGRIYVDANTSTPIAKETAEEWAENFKNANPNSIWFHYFGQNIFDEILSNSDFAALNIIPALNDLDLSPQLLLVVGIDLNLLGRTNAETDVYDASYPCPKCAVE